MGHTKNSVLKIFTCCSWWMSPASSWSTHPSQPYGRKSALIIGPQQVLNLVKYPLVSFKSEEILTMKSSESMEGLGGGSFKMTFPLSNYSICAKSGTGIRWLNRQHNAPFCTGKWTANHLYTSRLTRSVKMRHTNHVQRKVHIIIPGLYYDLSVGRGAFGGCSPAMAGQSVGTIKTITAQSFARLRLMSCFV